MRISFVATAELAEHFPQREMGAPAIVEREARLEIRLRLALELSALA